MFWLLGVAHCLIAQIGINRPYREVRELHEDTVMLVEYEFLDPPEGPGDRKCSLLVKYARTWPGIERAGQVVTQYSKTERKDSFFFIAPRTGHYLFSLGEEGAKTPRSTRVAIYEGRKRDPKIFSSADFHAREIHSKIEAAVDYCKSIGDVQRFTGEDDEFRRCYRAVERIVFYSVLLKIVTAVATFFFFNRKIRDFYLAKKLIHE